MNNGTLARLQRWYLAQCDGDWEHMYGIAVGTLDNPGWSIRVDLHETEFERRPFDRFEEERSEHDWVFAGVEGGKWIAHCGPLNLEETVEIFLKWAEIP